jgi:hypothetical protein
MPVSAVRPGAGSWSSARHMQTVCLALLSSSLTESVQSLLPAVNNFSHSVAISLSSRLVDVQGDARCSK